jgi:hypothetical protein
MKASETQSFADGLAILNTQFDSRIRLFSRCADAITGGHQ